MARIQPSATSRGARRRPAFLRISYTIDTTSPRFPGNPPNRIEPIRAMAKGDTCNVAGVYLFNHNGTHVDAPNHYHDDGRRVVDCPMESFVFERPAVLSVTAGEAQPITADMLKPFAAQAKGRDILFLRTGFGERRREPAYTNNPYITLEAAAWLRAIPTLRAIGLDFLSPTNPNRKPLGHEVHRVLLKETRTRPPFFILEDLDLTEEALIRRFRRVYAIPLFVDGVDGMSATVFGEYV